MVFTRKPKVIAAVLLLATLIPVGAGWLSTGLLGGSPDRAKPGTSPQRPEARIRWEYKVVNSGMFPVLAKDSRDQDQRLDSLNLLGAEGWELAGIESGMIGGVVPQTQHMYIFKRRK